MNIDKEKVIKLLDSRIKENSNITIYVFEEKKHLRRYKNKIRWLNKDIILLTIDDILNYGLDGFRIKDYKFISKEECGYDK